MDSGRIACLRARFGAAVVLALSIWGTVCADTQAENKDVANRWWQTECLRQHSFLEGVTAVLRHFASSASSVADPERTLTFQEQGFQVRVGGTRSLYKWNQLKSVDLRSIAGLKSAFGVTVKTADGSLGGGELGVVELSCLQEMSAIIEKYAPAAIVSGMPRVDRGPLFDRKGHVLSDQDR